MTLPQAYNHEFKVDGLKVEFIGNSWTHYIFNYPINPNQTASFKIRVTKTQYRHIMIGILDYSTQKSQRTSYKSNAALCYNGSNGYKYPLVGNEGDGFKQGDVVEVQVNRSTSTVIYLVNGVQKASHSNNMLAESLRIFMPFVEMCSGGDFVEWVL